MRWKLTRQLIMERIKAHVEDCEAHMISNQATATFWDDWKRQVMWSQSAIGYAAVQPHAMVMTARNQVSVRVFRRQMIVTPLAHAGISCKAPCPMPRLPAPPLHLV